MEDGYTTETEAIRSDATIWRDAAADLDAPKTTVQAQTLTIQDIGLVADNEGFGDTYEQLRQRIQALLDGGQRSYSSISTTLDSVATTYDSQESINSGAMSRAGADLEG